jgi:hypothetical protein
MARCRLGESPASGNDATKADAAVPVDDVKGTINVLKTL